ncbi:MAG: hypothetical protein WC456_02190 [Patescibacteria group bacterium]
MFRKALLLPIVAVSGVLLFFSLPPSALAQTPTIHSVATGGSWSDSSTWVEDAVPGSDDIVEINGTVYITNDTTIAGLVIASGATLESNVWSAPRLTVNGDVVNNGLITELSIPYHIFSLYLTISGNITNNGTWNSSWTDLSSTQSRIIDGANPINSPVTFLDNFEILNNPVFNGGVDFNGKTVSFGATSTGLTLVGGSSTLSGTIVSNSSNQSLTVAGGSFTGTGSGSIPGPASFVISGSASVGGTIVASTTVFAAGSPAFHGDFTSDQFIIEGEGGKAINADTTFNGPLIIEQGATLQSAYWAAPRLTINGDVINDGTITEISIPYNVFRLYLTISGNITNNGTWNSSWTDLASSQSRVIDGSVPINSPVTFLNDMVLLNSPNFAAGVDFNSHNIILATSSTGIVISGGDSILSGTVISVSDSQSLSLTGGSAVGTASGQIPGPGSLIISGSTSISGIVSASSTVFATGSPVFHGDFVADHFIMRGEGGKTINADTTFNGPLTIESGATLQSAYWTAPRLSVTGDVVNEGTITEVNIPYHTFSLYLTIFGNIINNGAWSASETDVAWPAVLGATGYLFNVSADNDNWPDPVTTANTYYEISDLVSSARYWRIRADLGNGLYSPWSSIKLINNSGFGGFSFNASAPAGRSLMATAPFTLTLQAKDVNGNNYNYSGTIALSATNGATTTPSQISMTGGYWSGTTTVAEFGNGVQLVASSSNVTSYSDGMNFLKKPVIIIPGIISSYLHKDDYGFPEVWPNLVQMALPGDDSYLDDLKMDAYGEPLSPSLMVPTDIFREIAFNDIFQGLITELTSSGSYTENTNLFVFPYDWRYSIDWIASSSPYASSTSLRAKIEEIKNSTGAEKVDIISHSMGGLVAKYYIEHVNTSTVDKFIDVATPHLGAPKAAKALLYGDDFGFTLFGPIGINETKMKEISQNFSSAYNLLPSRGYFDASSTIYNAYIADLYDYDNNSVTGNLDYDESIDFLNNNNLNSSMASSSDTLHNDLDNFDPDNYGVKAYNIIGCNQPTISRIYIINHYASSSYEYGLGYVNGDGTVPLKSAQALNNSLGTYYTTSTTHAFLPSFDDNKWLIYDILNSTSSPFVFNYTQYPEMTIDSGDCTPLDGWEVSYHSPIALHIYDDQGRHIGPDAKGNIEINIPGAAYDIIGDNKFAFVPKGRNYKIIGQATGLGHFNARIQDIQAGKTISTAYYNEVPIKSLKTNIEIDFVNKQPNYEMKIDQKGDRVFRDKVRPSAILNTKESEDRIKPETKAIINDQTIKLVSTDDNSKILKTEYSLDAGKTWNLYTKPIDISGIKGESTIQYKSTDRAGNEEIVNKQNISKSTGISKSRLFEVSKIRF